MDTKAVTKAKLKLDQAKSALNGVKTSKDFDEFQNFWVMFLSSGNTIYTSLQQGAKINAPSKRWFDKKNCLRKRDALLQYLHQARNAENHGIEPVAELIPGGLNIGPIDPSRRAVISNSVVNISDNGVAISNLEGIDNLRIEMVPPKVILITVYNRGVPYAPPSEHKGLALTDKSPFNVASLGIAYFERLIEEAEGFAVTLAAAITPNLPQQ